MEAAVSVTGKATFSGTFSLNASWGHLYYKYHWWGKESIKGLHHLAELAVEEGA